MAFPASPSPNAVTGPAPDSSKITRPFNLLRYYTIVSLLVFFGALLVAIVLSTRLVYGVLLEMERDEADSLAEDLEDRLEAAGFGPAHWSEPLPESLKHRLETQLDNFNVREFTLFGLDGRARLELGPEARPEPVTWAEGVQAARRGELALRWETRVWWPVVLLGTGKRGLVETYAPVHQEGRIVGVARVRRDQEAVALAAHRLLPPLLAVASCGSLAIFVGLWFLVRQADIRLRAQRRQIEADKIELQWRNRRLEELGRRKDEFVAVCSHDLRSPLISIQAGCQVLLSQKKGALNEFQAEALRENLKGSRNVVELINDLLDLARLEVGREALRLARFDLGGLVREALKSHEGLARERQVALVLDAPETGPPLEADRMKVLRVCNNLLSNAIKHSAAGTVRVRMETLDSSVRLSVSDCGPGIKPEDHARLFDKFTSLAGDKQTRAEGTGLGLAITQELVQLHGGRIEVASCPGAGATFTVVLPLKPPGGDSAAQGALPEG